MMIDAQSISLSISIGEESPLEHAIRREPDARYYISRIKGCLLYIPKVVIGITV